MRADLRGLFWTPVKRRHSDARSPLFFGVRWWAKKIRRDRIKAVEIKEKRKPLYMHSAARRRLERQ